MLKESENKRQQIGIAGWNVQDGPSDPNEIGSNVEKMARMGVSAFCFQECTSHQSEELGGWITEKLPGWKKLFYHEEGESDTRGLAIVVNPDIFKSILEMATFRLPKHLKNAAPFFRGDLKPKTAISITFELTDSHPEQDGGESVNRLIRKRTLCLTNVHLNAVAPPSKKEKQLEPILGYLDTNKAQIKLVMGDLNKFDPISKKRIHDIMQEHGFYELLRGASKTADLSKTRKTKTLLGPSFVNSGIQLPQLLDGAYIFIREGETIQFTDKVLTTMKGSDHFPCVIFLSISIF